MALAAQMADEQEEGPHPAELFCKAHGAAFVEWLEENTVECDCEVKYGCDETKRHGDEAFVNADTELTCRRCFVPIGLHDVSLRAPLRGPAPLRHCPPPPLWPVAGGCRPPPPPVAACRRHPTAADHQQEQPAAGRQQQPQPQPQRLLRLLCSRSR